MIPATSTTEVQLDKMSMPLKKQPLEAARRFPDINTLRDTIPKHCFEPSSILSLTYFLRDLILVGAMGWAAATYIPSIADPTTRAIGWTVYGFAQGLAATGLWILGHEAGHGAFSKSPLLNDIVGFFSHSALMVPYYSWKFSHRRHHMYTGHMEKDMVFVPPTRAEYMERALAKLDYLEDTPTYQVTALLLHQTFGWLTYLGLNLSAGKDSRQKKSGSLLNQSHIDPFSAVFRRSEAPYVLVSDIGLCITMGSLYLLSDVLGARVVLLLYAQPYFWVHHWLVAITYLHHTHQEVPHYDKQNWTFVKGALATIDRDFGFVGRHLFHGIIEYHVVHHLFPRIPFYHAEEATEALKPVLGDLYCRDERSFIGQLWTNFTTLKFVESDVSAPGMMKWAGKEAHAEVE